MWDLDPRPLVTGPSEDWRPRDAKGDSSIATCSIRISAHPAPRMEELLPDRWQELRDAPAATTDWI